jgi:hypothetical protein
VKYGAEQLNKSRVDIDDLAVEVGARRSGLGRISQWFREVF